MHIPDPALGACLETGSRGSRSGQLCLYVHILQAHSGVDLLTTACTAYSSLSDSGVVSHGLLGKEKHFGLLLSNVKVRLCWLCLEAACPLKSVCLIV